jgi:hypothetical protein
MRAAVRDYIARTSPRYGALTAARLVQAMGLLPQFPESGRIFARAGDHPAVRVIGPAGNHAAGPCGGACPRSLKHGC